MIVGMTKPKILTLFDPSKAQLDAWGRTPLLTMIQSTHLAPGGAAWTLLTFRGV